MDQLVERYAQQTAWLDFHNMLEPGQDVHNAYSAFIQQFPAHRYDLHLVWTSTYSATHDQLIELERN